MSNPPYVAEHEVADLPADVADWEPRPRWSAGRPDSRPSRRIVADAPEWLDPGGGGSVVELAPHQAGARARDGRAPRGFADVDVRRDLADRDRVLVARFGAAGRSDRNNVTT